MSGHVPATSNESVSEKTGATLGSSNAGRRGESFSRDSKGEGASWRILSMEKIENVPGGAV